MACPTDTRTKKPQSFGQRNSALHFNFCCKCSCLGTAAARRGALDAFLAKLERLKQDLPGESLERDFIQAAQLRAGLRDKP